MGTKISELPIIDRLPEGGETLLPVAVAQKGSLVGVYRVSINDIVEEIKKQIDDDFSIEMEETPAGIRFSKRWKDEY